MRKKLCIFCKYFYFEQAEPGYSEYTPGSETFGIECLKGHWIIDGYEDTTETYRQKILTAEKCKDFKFELKKIAMEVNDD